MRNKLVTFAGVVLLILFAYWMYKELAKPLPGDHFDDLGRQHTDDISEFVYNSNPATSGTHFPMWAKKGVYDRMISDGYLVHSLEHGYVVISYDCSRLTASYLPKLVSEVFAHEGVDHESGEEHVEEKDSEASGSAKPLTRMSVELQGSMSAFTPENAPTKEVDLPESFNSQSCKDLINKLSSHLNNWERLIIVPRLGMSEPIALTAWTRLLSLNSYDGERIEEFIKTYHNKGPEKTVE